MRAEGFVGAPSRVMVWNKWTHFQQRENLALPTETKVESGNVAKQKWNLC